MKPRPRTALLWLACILVLVGVARTYTQPDLMVQLANTLWSCF